jgi:hypothetical protein
LGAVQAAAGLSADPETLDIALLATRMTSSGPCMHSFTLCVPAYSFLSQPQSNIKL